MDRIPPEQPPYAASQYPPTPPKERPVFSLRDRLMTALAFLAGLLVITVFWRDVVPRLGVLLIAAATVGLFVWYFGERVTQYNRAGLALLCGGVLLAFSLMTNHSMALYFLNLLAVYLLLGLGMFLVSAGGEMDAARPRALLTAFLGSVASLFRNLDKPVLALIPPKGKGGWIPKVFVGLLISWPVAGVVLVLLSSADAVFSGLIDSFLRLNPMRVIARVVYAMVYAFLFYSFLYAAGHRRVKKDYVRLYEKTPPAFDGIVPLTLTLLLTLIYAVFVCIQLTYLFGGHPPAGLSYAEYARRGFFELFFITGLNIAVLLLSLTLSRRDSRVYTALRVTGGLMMGFTLVILASAVTRMLLYVSVYGLSGLRFLVLWGECVLFLFIVFSLVKLFRPDFRSFRFFAGTALVLYLALSFCPMDALIAGYNVNRFNAGEPVDCGYLATLSQDALPAARRLPDSPEKEEVLRQLERKRDEERGDFFGFSF